MRPNPDRERPTSQRLGAASVCLAAYLLSGAPTALAATDTPSDARLAVASAPPQAAPSSQAVAKVREQLARALAQRARNMLQRDRVYLGMLESAEKLIREAVELAPDNAAIWRVALDLATTMEDGDPAAGELLSLSLKRLSELEPDNEFIRLRRILDLVSRKQTVEERLEIYNQLLAPESVAKLGNPVAARLAFDAALLRRRNGDIAGFERELLHAVDLDPSYPEATEVAAGYFRMRAPSAVEDAEAMRVALIANPVRTPAALGLAALCLERGAYRAAAKILEVEAEVLETPRPDPVYDGLLTDLATAYWGSDQIERAFALLLRRQRILDNTLLEQLDANGAILSPDERSEVRMPIAPQLAAAFAALTSIIRPTELKLVVGNCAFAYEVQIEAFGRITKDPSRSDVDKARVASEADTTRLEAALVQLWLDGDADKAARWIDQASATNPLSDDARARFDGWLALRKGETDKARELFERVAARDEWARLGLAVIAEAAGDRKAAARGYLAIARENPNTSLGLWCRGKLRAILEKPVDVVEGAELVEQAATLPPAFLDLMREGARRVLLRIIPRQLTVRPWDALLFDVELTNLSEWPLAISQEGPIADTMTITAAINVPGQMPGVPPFAIVSLDQRLVLEPRKPVRIPVDVSLTDASMQLRADPIAGAFLSVHGILNWRTTAQGLEPGPLGVEVESPPIHVGGARLTAEWVKERLAELADPSQVPDPETIALLAHAHRKIVREAADADPAVVEALAGTGQALADAARRLWPEARAWLAYGAPHAPVVELSQSTSASIAAEVQAEQQASTRTAPVPELEPLMTVLREDQDFIVRFAWLSVRALRPEDPVLEASLGAADPRVADFAKTCKSWLVDVQEERRSELNLR